MNLWRPAKVAMHNFSYYHVIIRRFKFFDTCYHNNVVIFMVAMVSKSVAQKKRPLLEDGRK